jgi:hypothetical protein
MDRRDAHIFWPPWVLADGFVDNVVVEAEARKHKQEPRTLRAQQPIRPKVQPILRRHIRRIDVRVVLWVEREDKLVEAMLLELARALRFARRR